MSTAEEHNLKKASAHAGKALNRLRTIQLDRTNILTSFQGKLVDAYIAHLDDLSDSIDNIRKEVAEKHKRLTTTAPNPRVSVG